MSSQKVTLQELLTTWSIIADKKNVYTMVSEMESFVVECKNAGLTIHEVSAKKNKILGLWVDETWSEAKRKNPHWKDKSYWEKRRGIVERAFPDAVKAAFIGEVVAKQPQAPSQAKSDDQLVKESFTVFDNVEDFLKHKQARRVAGGDE